MRYAALKQPYALRGFLDQPYALVNLKNGMAEFLDWNTFQLLNFCDGTLDLDVMLLTPGQRKSVYFLEKKGIIGWSETPAPVNKSQRYRKADNRYLRSVHWSVTGRCNLKCRHCYMSAPDYKYKDMTTEECFRVVEQFRRANVQTVSITGGEPFLRADLFEILNEIYRNGMEVSQIYTNGTLLYREYLGWFEERNVTPQFVISFDGVEGHDWLRGKHGAKEMAVGAIRLLKRHGFSVMVETALCGRNLGSLEATYRLLRELGVDYWKASMIFEAGKWKEQVEGSISQEELYEAYLALIRSYIKDRAPLHLQLDGFFACPAHRPGEWFSPYRRKTQTEGWEDGFSCMTCRVHPYLLPDGTLLPCASMTDSILENGMPNLKEEPLGEIYGNPSHPLFGISGLRVGEIIRNNEDCRGCEYRQPCGGGCRAMSCLEGRGLMGHSRILCDFFKGGYELKIKRTVENAVLHAAGKEGMR